jgi:hypothetical protein
VNVAGISLLDELRSNSTNCFNNDWHFAVQLCFAVVTYLQYAVTLPLIFSGGGFPLYDPSQEVPSKKTPWITNAKLTDMKFAAISLSKLH